MKKIILLLILMNSLGNTMASQLSKHIITAEYKTIILGEIESIDEHRIAKFKIIKIYGNKEIETYKVKGKNTIIETKKIASNEVMSISVGQIASFDEDGSPLVLIKHKGEMTMNELKTGQRYLYSPESLIFFSPENTEVLNSLKK